MSLGLKKKLKLLDFMEEEMQGLPASHSVTSVTICSGVVPPDASLQSLTLKFTKFLVKGG
jgi:hypothetical protein